MTARVLIVLCVLLLVRSAGEAEGVESTQVESAVKAAFLYNFARFVEWPPVHTGGAIRIGVLGKGEVGGALEDVVRGKTVNGRPIRIWRLTSAADADQCEILLIERSEVKHLKEILPLLAGKPVLTVCDGASCVKDGGMIAFQIVDESVRFQISQESAQRAGLKISSQLLKVALPFPEKHQ